MDGSSDGTGDGTTTSEMSATAHDPSESPFVELGEKLFKLRDYTPIPLALIVIYCAYPTVRTATLGLTLVVAGELLRVYAVAFIGSVSRTRNTSTTGGALIDSGPFAWVRNPLYVGNFLISFGLSVFAGYIPLMVLTAVLFAIQYHAIVKYEEKLLTARFGREYDEYRSKVPAWIPTRMPSLEEIPWPDTFSPAIRSERRTLAAIVGMVLLLVLFRAER
jgi:protein-S-isoprenylcysteine O-methyltransferase Ste14